MHRFISYGLKSDGFQHDRHDRWLADHCHIQHPIICWSNPQICRLPLQKGLPAGTERQKHIFYDIYLIYLHSCHFSSESLLHLAVIYHPTLWEISLPPLCCLSVSPRRHKVEQRQGRYSTWRQSVLLYSSVAPVSFWKVQHYSWGLRIVSFFFLRFAENNYAGVQLGVIRMKKLCPVMQHFILRLDSVRVREGPVTCCSFEENVSYLIITVS